ncbi:MAG: hypothetical protein Q3974_05885 [Rothia sp. (in: high G+C Gram-positive bacteria)]|nr:hypothetical protein [Rothia sp. (in: high G+C Gram-positive bacteria)]
MEIWTLNHPRHGLIEVERGYDREFNELYPDWPEPTPTNDDGAPQESLEVPLSASLKERGKALLRNPPLRLQIKVNGEPVRRYKTLKQEKLKLNPQAISKLSDPEDDIISRNKPHLSLLVNQFKEILHIDFREGSEVVEFEPPAGSRGERRQQAMESSPVKRLMYPMLCGLGRGGWALAILLLGPVFSRIMERLLQFLPDWDLPPLPDLPKLPSIHLPVPTLPHIELPVIRFPHINLPNFEVPAWVEFLLDYSNIWVPVLIGVLFAIGAFRNHRKSEEQKEQWKAEQGKTKPENDKPDQEKKIPEDQGTLG